MSKDKDDSVFEDDDGFKFDSESLFDESSDEEGLSITESLTFGPRLYLPGMDDRPGGDLSSDPADSDKADPDARTDGRDRATADGQRTDGATASGSRRNRFSRDGLLDELRETIGKLEQDQPAIGDLKLLSRSLKELRYAFKVFSQYRLNRKVTVFGSARTPPEAPAYQHSLAYGRMMAQAGWMVLTGAGGGIMEGAHVGAGREMSMGVNIMLPFEQSANHIIEGDPKLVNLRYFFTRKLLFVKEVHAVALFPGGFGTQDEGFETLTLLQTGKRDMMPLLCIDEPGGTYWSAWQKFIEDQLLKSGLISEEDMSLFLVTDNLDEAYREVIDFYQVYDSMRYIRDSLIIRLRVAPSDQYIEQLNDEYSDILTAGSITRADTHEHERDEIHIQHLPRLKLKFNRRNQGRLRQMINQINRELADQVR